MYLGISTRGGLRRAGEAVSQWMIEGVPVRNEIARAHILKPPSEPRADIKFLLTLCPLRGLKSRMGAVLRASTWQKCRRCRRHQHHPPGTPSPSTTRRNAKSTLARRPHGAKHAARTSTCSSAITSPTTFRISARRFVRVRRGSSGRDAPTACVFTSAAFRRNSRCARGRRFCRASSRPAIGIGLSLTIRRTPSGRRCGRSCATCSIRRSIAAACARRSPRPSSTFAARRRRSIATRSTTSSGTRSCARRRGGTAGASVVQ